MEIHLFHGTAAGDAIRAGGFEASLSGGGQAGLRGVWLIESRAYALRYAACSARYDVGPGEAEVLPVRVPEGRYADLRGLGAFPVWEFLFGPGWAEEPDRVAEIRRYGSPFGATAALQARGYVGAVRDNTLDEGGPAEVVVFDPRAVEVL
jgi:hypothetical protein